MRVVSNSACWLTTWGPGSWASSFGVEAGPGAGRGARNHSLRVQSAEVDIGLRPGVAAMLRRVYERVMALTAVALAVTVVVRYGFQGGP